MRYLKLLLIFLVLVGGVFFIINWLSNPSDPDSPQEEKWSAEEKFNIKNECKKIKDAWAKEEGWNEELYTKLRADIDQSKAMELYTMEDYEAVDSCLQSIAFSKISDSYAAALHHLPFSEAELKKQHEALELVKKSGKLTNDPNAMKVEELHQLYTAAKVFVDNKHEVTPHFDAESNSWVPFNDHQKNILDEASALNKNPLIAEVNHLPGFKDALKLDKVKSATDELRHSYYEELCNQIVNHFRDAGDTRENYSRMDEAINKFASQYQDQDLVQKMVDVQFMMGKNMIKE